MQSIAELKKMVVGPSNLNKTLHYFFDLMENNTLLRSGVPLTPGKIKKNRELQAMINSIEHMLSDFFGKKIRVSQPMLTLIPREQLFHGFCTTVANNLPIPIVYFSDIKMGIFAVTGFDQKTDSFRFALIESSTLDKAH